MDTMNAILSRKSVRRYTGEKISEGDLTVILKAAKAAPVAMGQYETVHLTAIESPDLLSAIDAHAANTLGKPELRPLYNAPTLIVVSTNAKADEKIPCSNAAIVVHSMAMAATEMGIGCCHIWGAIMLLGQSPELLGRLELPDGFTPSCAIVLGVTDEKYTLRDIPDDRISVNHIK